MGRKGRCNKKILNGYRCIIKAKRENKKGRAKGGLALSTRENWKIEEMEWLEKRIGSDRREIH